MVFSMVYVVFTLAKECALYLPATGIFCRSSNSKQKVKILLIFVVVVVVVVLNT